MATVIIWNNNKVTLGRSYPGHASMSINDNWGGNGDANYVSFWPDGSAGVFKTNPATTGGSLREDLGMEKYVPDHIIRIAGANVSAMMAEWKKTRQDFKTYQYVRQNCSTAVARVLKAGSSSGSIYQRHSAVWTPLKVKRLALSMGGTKMTWTALLAELVAAGSLTRASADILAKGGKRDARHGSSTDIAVHQGGRKVTPAPGPLTWAAPTGNQLIAVKVSGGELLDRPAQMKALFDAFDREDDDDSDSDTDD